MKITDIVATSVEGLRIQLAHACCLQHKTPHLCGCLLVEGMAKALHTDDAFYLQLSAKRYDLRQRQYNMKGLKIFAYLL